MNADRITSVIVSASSYDLTTLVAVKDELSITDGASDATLKRYISSASAAVANECNRVFPVETVQDTFIAPFNTGGVLFSSRPAPLRLSRWPVVSVASVTVDGVPLSDIEDFVVDAIAGQIFRVGESGRYIGWRGAQIVVVFAGGFDPIPSDLEDGVIRLVTKRWSAKGRDATLKSESIPGVLDRQFWIATGTDAGNLTPDIADLIDGYRVPVLA